MGFAHQTNKRSMHLNKSSHVHIRNAKFRMCSQLEEVRMTFNPACIQSQKQPASPSSHRIFLLLF